MIKSLQISNPRVIEIVHDEMNQGSGRSYSETAENLILESVEARKIRRAVKSSAASMQGNPESSQKQELESKA